jgi:2-polyprenyl-6-methoxyphenol hydroxylase-like FAD-dependent oxidoreductase
MSTTHQARRRVRIVGGSLGGLFTANLLHRAGWDVKVYERSADELAGRGAGVVTHPELFQALELCGIPIDDSLGVRVTSRLTLASDGTVQGRLDMEQVLTAWGWLYQVLHKTLLAGLYINGVKVDGVEELSNGALLKFSDGRSEAADLVVAADGIRSTLRQQLLPSVKADYAGYIAWRGLAEERNLSTATRDLIFDKFSFCLPPQEQILGYPVAGSGNRVTVGDRRYNFVWYRPVMQDSKLVDLLTDSAGRRYKGGIPPQSIRSDVITRMRSDAERVLAPQFAEIIRHTEQPFFQPIYDLCSPRLAFGHTALLGDAAFVARPHCGMGVTKAAGDAMALVRALQSHGAVPQALQAYEEERGVFGAAVVNHARHLGAYMQAQIRNDAEREMAERYRTPEAVMRETASSRAFELKRVHAPG